jgi:predicted enzyme related to lactoylglutathione lyase
MAFVEHFEIPADDVNRAKTFYKNVLDFDYEPWGDEMGMLRQPDGKGIGGDLHVRGTSPHPTVVFTVDNIEATVERAIAAGGAQLGEIQALSETARWVYITDSEGNIIGLYDDSAGAA